MIHNLPHSFVELLFDRLDPDRFISLFLEALTSIQKVERGSLWIIKGDGYECVEACGADAGKVKGHILSRSRESIVGKVIESRQMTIFETVREKLPPVEKSLSLDIKNTLILCFPLIQRDGGVYGAVKIYNTSAGGEKTNLDPDYLNLLEGIVTLGGIALSASLHLADHYEKDHGMRKVRNYLRSSPLMIGRSESFLRVMKTARIYASKDFPVMITGESGTGKELLAGEIHRLSSRRSKPFMAQNCSAIPATLLESELFGYKKGAFTGADTDTKGLFEAADGGSIFLDEIGDMPLDLQAKILRVLQNQEVKPLGTTSSKKVDVRIISATNKDLTTSMEKGEFRRDLYYRLNVLPLLMPPLRDRKEDVPLLFTHFMKHFSVGSDSPPKTLCPEAMEVLVEQPWPGNIREMENLAKYLITVTDGELVHVSDLPPPYSTVTDAQCSYSDQGEPSSPDAQIGTGIADPLADTSLRTAEKRHMLSLLEMTRWNVTAAAGLAGIKRTTFSSRMKKLGIRRKG
ncbi:MAG: sigma 54-interacting transcriptional regulator [Pseudomonadota bacterium]|jgi:transcriptional regulator with GAF, ATPase, and Fis domain